MAPTADSAVFVDTNILVYSSFPGTLFHEAARARLSELEANGVVFWLSRQVLREFLAVTTRPGSIVPAPSLDSLLHLIQQFESAFQIADDDAVVTTLLIDLMKFRTIHGKQIHDANIVATMKRHEIRLLLTHNAIDFARYAPDISVLPLIPDELVTEESSVGS